MVKGQTEKTKALLIKELGEAYQQLADLSNSESMAHKLETSELRYRRLFETAQDGILILDAVTGRITDVNPFLIEMLGYSKREFLGKRLWEIGPFKDIELSQEAFQELRSKGYVRYEHLPLETKNGHQISVEFVSNVYSVGNDRVIQCNIRDITERVHVEGALATARNELETKVKERTSELAKANEELVQEINERKRAELELKESEGRFQALTENTSDLIWETNTSGVYTYVNPNAKDLLGYDPGEMVGKTMFDFVPEKDRARVAREFRAIVKSQRPFVRLENTNLRNDGRLIVLETSGIPFFYADGRLSGYRGVGRDITERERLEEEQRKIEKLESVGTLAGGIAHDFNNLLTGIMGNISLAKRYVEPKGKAFERLEEAERASLRARDLTQQLLTFSRGGAPVKKVLSIAQIVKESATFALRGSRVKPVFSLPEDLWTVEADEGQINRVIHNLVRNADEAMPEGGVVDIKAKNIAVQHRNTLPLSKGRYVEIAIIDSGVGIKKEHLARMFEPYFTTKQKGSGLGLATSYSVIKNHGGHISVESTSGVGTTFCIYLPALKKEVPKKKEEEVQTALLGQGRILVMDDEETVREFLRAALTEVGYEVELTNDGEEAINRYAEAKEAGQPFDAVILDLTVPGGMGGKEAVKKLREIAPNVKVIVSSGYATDPMMSNYKKFGFSAVVTKPYSVTEIEKALHSLLRKRE